MNSSLYSSCSTGSTTCSQRSGLISVSPSIVRHVLGRDQELLDLDRAIVLVADGDLGLAVRAAGRRPRRPCGPRPAGARACARSGSASASAPASPGSRSRTSSPGRRLRCGRARRRRSGRCGPRRPSSTPWAMSGDCSSIAVITAHVSASNPYLAAVVADLVDRLARTIFGMSTYVCVEISPATTTRPGVDEALTGDATGRIVGHHRVEDAVRDLVADLVGMPLGDGLRGEQELVLGQALGLHGWRGYRTR